MVFCFVPVQTPNANFPASITTTGPLLRTLPLLRVVPVCARQAIFEGTIISSNRHYRGTRHYRGNSTDETPFFMAASSVEATHASGLDAPSINR